MLTNRGVMRAKVLVLMVVLAPAARAADRPTAPPRSLVRDLEAAVAQDEKKLQAASRTTAKYTKAIRAKVAEVAAEERAVSGKRSGVRQAEQSWNTGVNPTCQSGRTYAQCSCRPGSAGKAAKQAEIARLRDQVSDEERKRNRAKRELDGLKTGARRFQEETQTVAAQLKEDRRRLVEERQRQAVSELTRKTPNVIPLGGKP